MLGANTIIAGKRMSIDANGHSSFGSDFIFEGVDAYIERIDGTLPNIDLDNSMLNYYLEIEDDIDLKMNDQVIDSDDIIYSVIEIDKSNNEEIGIRMKAIITKKR